MTKVLNGEILLPGEETQDEAISRISKRVSQNIKAEMEARIRASFIVQTTNTMDPGEERSGPEIVLRREESLRKWRLAAVRQIWPN